MSFLNEIKDINNLFKTNLTEKADIFPHTSSIISDFNSYLSKNKTLLYAMAGIALSMGLGKTFNAQDFQERDKATHSYSAAEIIQQNNMISNKNFNENLPSLTDDIVNQLETIKDQQAFKNPFWDNNIVTIKVDNTATTNYGEDFSLTPEKSYEVNLQNSLYLVDSDSNYITWNKALIDEQKEFVEHKDLFVEQIIYHEAAHAAFTQVSKFSGEHRDITQREMESDVASMLMIGVKHNSLDTFNKAMDDGIKFRSYVFEQGDSEHNTLYALIELKNIVNDHPELLKMPSNEIVYFANNLVTQISSKTFNLDADEQSFKSSELLDSFHVIDNMKNNDINYTKYLTQNFLAKKGMNSDLDSLKNMNERRLNKLAEGVQGVNQNLDHNSYSALVYFKEGQQFDKAIEKLSDMAKHDSKVESSFINDTLKRIKLQDLEFDFSKIKTIQDKRLASDAEQYIKTTTFKL